MMQPARLSEIAIQSQPTNCARLCLAWFAVGLAALMISGCATPVASPTNSLTSQPAPTTSPAHQIAQSPTGATQPALDVASLYGSTSVTSNVPGANATINQPAIAQVGFRDRAACGCGNTACAGQCGSAAGMSGDCVACQPMPAAPMMRAPWGVDPQEFLCDGGDHDPQARLTRGDVIAGLQPEDTVTHYTTEAGDIEFSASNRVCVYSPRFASVRRITGAIENDRSITVGGTFQPVGPLGIDLDQPGLVMTDTTKIARSELTRRVDAMRDRNRGVPVENVQQIEVAEDVLALLTNIRQLSLSELDKSQLALVERFANAAIAWSIDESVEVEIQDLKPPTLTRDQKVDAVVVYDFPEAGRVNLIKLADKQHAPVGDTVTFALRLQNVGDSPVNGVVVTDNLTTRLEYVVDSESASMDTEYSIQPNQAGSDQLIWKLTEELGVGETVTIEFECKVR
ncbi:DUF11 domain-containing protein [Rhodopirellula bahusiensis]|uniref:DUF11 domain-containing protein n=3 Tax=Rhodopirellula bahusiensis TaxID=2014065 RepID=UPI0032631A8C